MAFVDYKELKGMFTNRRRMLINVDELEEGYLYPDLYETVDELG